MSSTSDIVLEEQLLDAGNKLLDPSSSDDELLSILDQVESCLLRVEQSPAKSMQTALSPSLRALVADQLLEHPNVDVKVSVASCISEITRITAPDAPYDDDEMKKVFQLIVSSFENLPDKSSRSYNKRVSILETVSKVRSCVVMLDLECDALILEMFKHFLKAIRDYHPDNVFFSMETVMALVLEESEDISPELLSPILASVKKDSEEVLSIARRLGERVLESSASKVKPYLIQTVKSLGIHLKDYSQVVASICEQDASSAIGQSDDHATLGQVEDSKLETSSDDAALVDKEIAKEEASPKCVDSDTEKSPKPVVSNVIAQTGEDESFLVSGSKKQEETSQKEEDDQHDQYKVTNVLSKVELDNVIQKAECKLDQTTKQRGRKTSSSKSEEPSDGSHAANEKEEEELLDSNKNNSKDDATSLCEEPSNEAAVPPDIVNDTNPSIEAAAPSDIVKDTNSSIEAAAPSGIVKDAKALQSESGNVVSPPPGGGLPEEGRTRKVGRPKKKHTSTKYTTSVAGVISNKTPEGQSDPEVKKANHSGKKHATRIPDEDRGATIVTSNNESTAASDSDVKTSKKSNKQVETSGENGDGSSLKHQEGSKKQGHFKDVIEKDVSELSDKDDKEVVSSPESNRKAPKDEDQMEETPQSNSKRKRTPVVEKAPGAEDGKDLVGAKIKVWWPKDKMYYEGVVDSYDSAKNKHKVLYIDGDEEVLNLRREKWERVTSNSISDEGEADGESSPDASSDVPLNKKLKANSDLSAKVGSSSSKRGRGASSNKAKGSASRPGRKSGTDSRSKSDPLKKLDDASASKSKLHTAKSGSKSASQSKAPNKSKDNDDDETESCESMDIDITPKSAAKTKQDTPKTIKSKQDTQKAVSKSRGKNSRGGAKSSANSSSKVKARSTKVKETEDIEDASSESEAPETVLLKSANSSKARGGGNRSGKKRRRGGRS